MWLSIGAVFTVLRFASAGQANFRGAGRLSRQDASDILRQEVADKDHHLTQFEEALRERFTSLPKNEYGNLEHQVVRYALHRFFVDRYGWYIAGLEQVAASGGAELPSFLQSTVEGQFGARGVDLHGLAALAASIEGLATKETRERLKSAYSANDLDASALVHPAEAAEVLYTLFISFLNANNFNVNDAEDLQAKKQLFQDKYRDYGSTMEWYYPIRDRFIGNDTTQKVSFDILLNATMEIDKTYFSYNEVTCKDLRSTLTRLESRTPGRVRLSAFYNMSLHGLWDFNERIEFLRALGALDESDPKQPTLIIPNYAGSRLNCLNATNTYTICCRNICDDLTAQLEKQFGSSTATTEQIIEVVSRLPSESIDAPRELPSALIDRLNEVAAHHGGQVPLHGRLFAQWMHHAYPRECPFPHEAGIVSVQTPEEWLAQTGEATEMASAEEMRDHVAADVCAVNWEGKLDCGEESTELPWSMTEQLLVVGAGGEQQSEGRGVFPVLALLLVFAAVGVLGRVRSRPLHHRREVVMLAAFLLAAGAYCANLLDGAVFSVAFLGSCTFAGARVVIARVGASGCSALPIRQAKHV